MDKEAEVIAANDGKKPEKDGKKPLFVKQGLNHCVALIEVSTNTNANILASH